MKLKTTIKSLFAAALATGGFTMTAKAVPATEFDIFPAIDAYFADGDPHIIEEVKIDTKIDTSKLPKAERLLPEVTINEVKSGDPWDSAKGTITVVYALANIDATKEYKVAFDITAKGQTVGVTNDAATLVKGPQEAMFIDTAKLFGRDVTDNEAEVKVSLIEVKAALGAVQLWENGPFWAECNVGTSEVEGHPEYGALYTFDMAGFAVKSILGSEWRLPTISELKTLVDRYYCVQNWDGTRKGWIFSGARVPYVSNSIFLPVAGYGSDNIRTYDGIFGRYWSSLLGSYDTAYYLSMSADTAYTYYYDRNCGMSVRAVRDTPALPEETFIAFAETKFVLGLDVMILTPGVSSYPFESAEAAQAAVARGAVVFGPTNEIEAVLTKSTIISVEDYKKMFTHVVYQSGDKWRVMYGLTDAATNALNRSIRAVITNLDVRAIAEIPGGESTNLVTKGGVPGFYYTLFKSGDVTTVREPSSHDKANSDRLCDKDGVVTFENVTKPTEPSDAAGFFTVSVSPAKAFDFGDEPPADFCGGIIIGIEGLLLPIIPD